MNERLNSEQRQVMLKRHVLRLVSRQIMENILQGTGREYPSLINFELAAFTLL